MPVSTSTNYFSNAIIGVPQVGADIDVHQVDLTPRFQVGFGFERADGNKYRYCHFGADTNRGLLVSQDMNETNVKTPIIHVGSTVANNTRPEGEIIDPNAIGSHYIQCSMTAVAHQFAGAYASVASATGLGYTYRVKDNTATGTPKAGEIYLELYKPIVVAVDSNTGFQVVGSLYSDLEGMTTTDRIAAGATVSGVSDTNYAWICTKGVTSILQDASIGTDGLVAYSSTNTTGAVSYIATGALLSREVGQFIIAATAANYSVVKLELE